MTHATITLGSAAAALLFNKDFGQTEAPAGQFLGILITDQSHTFLTDFRQKDLPSLLRQLIRFHLRPLLLGLMLLRRTGSLLLVMGGRLLWSGGLVRSCNSHMSIFLRVVVCSILSLALTPPAFALGIFTNGLRSGGCSFRFRPVTIRGVFWRNNDRLLHYNWSGSRSFFYRSHHFDFGHFFGTRGGNFSGLGWGCISRRLCRFNGSRFVAH